MEEEIGAGGLTAGEIEAARDAGFGIMTSDDPAVDEAYRQQLIQIGIKMVTIQMSLITRKEQDKVNDAGLAKVISIWRSCTVKQLEDRIARLYAEKPEFVLAAMEGLDVRLEKTADGIRVVKAPQASSLIAPGGGRYITEGQFERMLRAG